MGGAKEGAVMIGSVTPGDGRIDARTLPAVFSNDTRCPNCRATSEIWVLYDPGCEKIVGPHYHRECRRCGQSWPERSAGHTSSDIVPGDPRFVLICERCHGRVPEAQALAPRCCARPDPHYHDTAEACPDCARFVRRR